MKLPGIPASLGPLKYAQVTSERIKIHTFPLQKFSSAQPVSEEQPKKYFVFHLTFGTPDPIKNRMSPLP
jgi:hypothetical protein